MGDVNWERAIGRGEREEGGGRAAPTSAHFAHVCEGERGEGREKRSYVAPRVMMRCDASSEQGGGRRYN